MVVLTIDMLDILADPSERDSPITAHLHGPGTLSGTAKLVQVQAWQIHIERACRNVQTAKDQTETIRALSLDP
jgi:hypothetical protein